MIHKLTALALCWALLHATAAVAAPQENPDAKRLAEVKAKVHRAGVGETARVSVKFKDGRRLKGYVAESREDDFVLRDEETDAPTTVAFSDVSKVEVRRPPASSAKKTMDVLGIGAGVLLIVLLVHAFHNLD